MEIVLVGLNHRTAPVEVRERVSFTAEQARRAAEELRARGILEETLVLSTCNRSEVYGVPPESSHECAPGLSTFLSEFHSVRPDILGVSLYHHYDREAERIFGKLSDRKALVLGAGTISEQVVSQLRDRGIAQLQVMNRSREGADELAKQFGGKMVGWGEWDTALQSPDVVVSSVSAEEPVLLRDIVQRAMAARGNRALFLMDLGVPRNIDPGVGELYNVYVYNTDDLTEIVQQNRNARESEVPRAQGIVDEHVTKFLSWQASVELVGLVDALRVKMREERAAFIRSRMEPMKHLTETDRAHVEKLMDEMLEKLLLGPAERLRGEKELRRKIQNVEALRDLFLSNREKT